MPLFDTRISSLPSPSSTPVISGDSSTALDGFPLVFEDQYLQLTSALPYGANIYGLGEVVASSGFRRDVGTDGGVGTIQTMWARDDADPIDQNMFVCSSKHRIYLAINADKSITVMVLIRFIWNTATTRQQTKPSHTACFCLGDGDTDKSIA